MTNGKTRLPGRLLILTAIATVVVGAAAAQAVVRGLVRGDEHNAAAVLSTPPTAVGALPEGIRHGALSRLFRAPIRAHFLTSQHGFRYYAVIGKDRQVCIVGSRGDAADAANGGSCDSIERLSRNVLWTAQVERDGVQYVTGLAPDGYTAVSDGTRTRAIRHNVFTIALRTTHAFVVSGPGLPDRGVDVGKVAPLKTQRHVASGR